MAIKCSPADLVRWEKAPLGFNGYKISKEIHLRVAHTLPSHKATSETSEQLRSTFCAKYWASINMAKIIFDRKIDVVNFSLLSVFFSFRYMVLKHWIKLLISPAVVPPLVPPELLYHQWWTWTSGQFPFPKNTQYIFMNTDIFTEVKIFFLPILKLGLNLITNATLR